jgi:hypothetical protein
MPMVHVTLVDASTNQVLGDVDLAAEQLPESFAASTTLHLGGGDWHVEHADPVTRAEYVATGRLQLRLRKVEYMDPTKILFSLPTLENVLPPMSDGDATGALVLHEDHWRQRELVSSRFEPEIAAELAEIRKVHAERKGAGFARLHVRERIPEPLHGVTMTIDDVARAVGTAVRCPVTFERHAGIVRGGFAFVREGLAIYGREDNGVVRALAIADGDSAPLAALARQHRLVIVDWCAARSA